MNTKWITIIEFEMEIHNSVNVIPASFTEIVQIIFSTNTYSQALDEIERQINLKAEWKLKRHLIQEYFDHIGYASAMFKTAIETALEGPE